MQVQELHQKPHFASIHNLAFYLRFGGESARSVDIGPTIFYDGKVHPLFEDGNFSLNGAMSVLMRIGYLVTGSPIAWIYELIVNGGF